MGQSSRRNVGENLPFGLGANCTVRNDGSPKRDLLGISLVTILSIKTWRFLRPRAGSRYAVAELLRAPFPTVFCRYAEIHLMNIVNHILLLRWSTYRDRPNYPSLCPHYMGTLYQAPYSCQEPEGRFHWGNQRRLSPRVRSHGI